MDDEPQPPQPTETSSKTLDRPRVTFEANLKTELKVRRLEKENHSLEAYNRELRDQVELMNAKLHLSKKFLYQNVESQTDIHIPPNEINGHVFSNCIMLPQESSSMDQDSVTSNANSKLKSDLDSLLNDIKSSSNSDYTYDAASKTYYSRSTGWYYYPVCFGEGDLRII